MVVRRIRTMGARCQSISLAISGIVCIGLAIGLHFGFQAIFHDQVLKNVLLTEGSPALENWKNPPTTVYMQFNFFNLINPDEVVNGGKPNVTEMGPYVFREVRRKKNLTWYENGTLSYIQPLSYIFERELSAGGENDIITTTNIPYITIVNKVKDMNKYLQDAVDLILRGANESLFKSFTVADLLWGYEDPILNLVHTLIPSLAPSSRFGLFLDKNGTDDGVYTTYTGEYDISKVNTVNMWKGQDHLTYWSTKYANMINGSADATLYQPFSTRKTVLELFSSDICRSIYATYNKDVTVKGIPLYKFTAPKSLFANYSINPDNAGFCTPDETHCLGSGVLNVSNCQQNAPIVMSSPHFLDADPKIIAAVDGIAPNSEIHQTYLDLEPVTGLIMEAAKRLQINVNIQPEPYFKQLKNVHQVYYPVLWLSEGATIDDDSVREYISKVVTPQRVVQIVFFTLICIGGLLIILACVVVMMTFRKQNQTLIVNEPTETSKLIA